MAVWAASKTSVDEVKNMEVAISQVVADESFQEKMKKASVNADFSSSKDLINEIDQLLEYWKSFVGPQIKTAKN